MTENLIDEVLIKVYRGKCEPILRGKRDVIRFYPNCLEYNFSYTYQSLNSDRAIPVKEYSPFGCMFIDKMALVCVNRTFSVHRDNETEEDCPVVILEVNGMADEIHIRCETEKVAIDLYEKLIKWRFDISL